MENKVLTKEGLSKLQEELDYLQNTKKHEVSDRIKAAKEFGDLSENAEYQDAKEEQAFVEGKILELSHLIKTSVIAEDNNQTGMVAVGCEVIVDKDGQKQRFFIVGSTEADPANSKISLESPLADALLGKAVGAEVEVELPAGKVVYKILEIK
jgi:transcription elongation factor GreA